MGWRKMPHNSSVVLSHLSHLSVIIQFPHCGSRQRFGYSIPFDAFTRIAKADIYGLRLAYAIVSIQYIPFIGIQRYTRQNRYNCYLQLSFWWHLYAHMCFVWNNNEMAILGFQFFFRNWWGSYFLGCMTIYNAIAFPVSRHICCTFTYTQINCWALTE